MDKLVVSLLFHLSLMDKWLVATGKRTVGTFFPFDIEMRGSRAYIPSNISSVVEF